MSEAVPGRLAKQRVVFGVIVIFAAVFDLWSKAEAFARLGPPSRGQHHEVIPGILRWETALNKGVAWSLLSEQNARWFIASLSIIAFPIIVGYFVRAKAPTWPFTIALSFIAGGTIGNLYDRVLHGAVRDFIYFHCINFPIFNIADSFICVGATLFALEHLFSKPEETPAKAESKPEPQAPTGQA